MPPVRFIAAASPALSQAAELVLPLTPGSYFLTVGKTAAYGYRRRVHRRASQRHRQA